MVDSYLSLNSAVPQNINDSSRQETGNLKKQTVKLQMSYEWKFLCGDGFCVAQFALRCWKVWYYRIYDGCGTYKAEGHAHFSAKNTINSELEHPPIYYFSFLLPRHEKCLEKCWKKHSLQLEDRAINHGL